MREDHYPRILFFDVGPGPSDSMPLPSPDKIPSYGYDVLVKIIKASNLPGADWWNGRSDPYVIINLTSPQGIRLTYRTRTAWRDLNPHYDEFFEVGNLPEGSQLAVDVWDKDLVTPDEILGKASWVFAPRQGGHEWHQQWQPCQQQLPTSGRLALPLQLHNPSRSDRVEGQLELEVLFKPSLGPGPARMLGPVRFRQHLSPTAGWIMGNWNDDQSMAYSTYKLYLLHIEDIFAGVKHPWNRDYDKAASIFNSPVMLAGVRSQHASLYATQLGECRMGVLQNAAEFFALFNNGRRGGQCRYFTYSLMRDSLRCSETGAKFSTDMFSKHAMHAGAAAEVLYAGEFCILPDPSAGGGHRLVIDNNSGTYAPKAEHLPLMARLFAENFSGMRVETLAAADPRLKAFHQLCPSRTSPNLG